MRGSNVTRRVRSSTANEEKKDDHHPTTSYPGATKLIRRRRKSKERTRFFNPMQWNVIVEYSPLIIAFIVLAIYFIIQETSFPGKSYLRWSPSLSLYIPADLRIVMPTKGFGSIRMPGPSLMHEDSSEDGPDYGHLDHHSDFDEEIEAREIHWGPDEDIYEHFAPSEHESWWDGHDAFYYAFDDDEKKNPYHGWDDEDLSKENHCRRVSFHRDLYLNCNNFHQLDVPRLTLENGVRFVGAGSYRDVFLVEQQAAVDHEMVLKIAEIGNDYDHEIYECMRMEGAVASQLSPHPLLVDIYGFCALSMFNEAMMKGDVEHKAAPIYTREHCEKTPDMRGPSLVPMNNLTATQKIDWALNMAEAMALLHNYEKGLIVHDDVQLPQFMVTGDGRLKLGDFNRAEFMLYDEEHGEYCKYRNGHGHGDWRSPEEYWDEPLNEKIDIWSLGVNFYTLLTGLYPIHDECHESKVKNYIKHGKLPYIDPRWADSSYAEGELAKIVASCWAYHAKDRPSIGDLVLRLRKVVEEHKKRGNT